MNLDQVKERLGDISRTSWMAGAACGGASIDLFVSPGEGLGEEPYRMI